MTAKTHDLTAAQQAIIRSLTAERTRALAAHDSAIAEYLSLLKGALKLKGNWTWAGTVNEIKLVKQPKPPKPPTPPDE